MLCLVTNDRCLLYMFLQLKNVGMNRANYHYLLGGLVRPVLVLPLFAITATALQHCVALICVALCKECQNVAYLPFNSWLNFQRLSCLLFLWGSF